ncbi:GtrA family protein [Vibrio salinus]|uniref:GtrA family protein n=1 Tax=Vibrio salinus TaxID=2899784 RepID=UPI001E2E52C3|nr:GtrA family protein [Vibrio salinus]MCE0494240.1 GtrA family protein [Vibrio salinus]
MKQLLKFALIGGIGFIVDTFFFTILFKGFDLDLMLARSIAFLLAATTTWFGNRRLTFSQFQQPKAFAQWKKFMVTACIGALPNFAVFKMVVLLTGAQGTLIYVALVLGILSGMCCNYVLSTKWVFR